MFQHQTHTSTMSGGVPVAAMLLADAEAALDNDLSVVRRCLRQLAGLLAPVDVGQMEVPARGGLASWQIRLVTGYIERNIGQTVSVGGMAEVARLSEGHFCRAFKASMGETPHGYVMGRRIAHAQRLMLTSSETLSQIASACGFTDQAHLTRLFRRFVGDTPLSWRRSWHQAA